MATLIIEMDGGLVNEVYSTLLEPLNIQVYDTDDRRDPEHAYLYAASMLPVAAVWTAAIWTGLKSGTSSRSRQPIRSLSRPI